MNDRDKTIEIGEIRQWLKPRGHRGEYHRFLVIAKDDCLEWGPSLKIRYSNGYVQEIWESDLLRDPDDPEDDEFSVGLDEIDSYAESSACSDPEKK